MAKIDKQLSFEQFTGKICMAILCFDYMELKDTYSLEQIEAILLKINVRYDKSEFESAINSLIQKGLIVRANTKITIKNRILLANFVLKNH